jgi:hypothetical protein
MSATNLAVAQLQRLYYLVRLLPAVPVGSSS